MRKADARLLCSNTSSSNTLCPPNSVPSFCRQVTDIAIIIVAADDGVRPQTREAVAHAQVGWRLAVCSVWRRCQRLAVGAAAAAES